MRKRVSLSLLILLLISSLLSGVGAAASAEITATAVVNNDTGLMTISGTIASGEGKEVSITVLSPTKAVSYVNQTTSGKDGAYSFSYYLTENVSGMYMAKVSGTGVQQPAESSIIYHSSPDGNNNSGVGSSGSDDNIRFEDGFSIVTLKTILVKDGQVAQGSVSRKLLDQMFAKTRTKEDGLKKVIFVLSENKDAKDYAVVFEQGALAKGNDQIEIRSPHANLFISKDSFTGLDNVDTSKIEIVLSHTTIGKRAAIGISAKINDKELDTSKLNRKFVVTVKYEPTTNELNHPEFLVITYVDEHGNSQTQSNSKYDRDRGSIVFTTNVLGVYSISYVEKFFTDIGKYPWAEKEIKVLAAKGITRGTTETTFLPEKMISRAEFIVLLFRTLQFEAESIVSFDDVKPSDYYYEAVGTAKKLGIVNGVGGNRFNPSASITRQDMMVMTAKALKNASTLYRSGSTSQLQNYKDHIEIAPYAIDSVAALIQMDIVKGSGNSIHPKGWTTRAEAAVLLYRIYNLLEISY